MRAALVRPTIVLVIFRAFSRARGSSLEMLSAATSRDVLIFFSRVAFS